MAELIWKEPGPGGWANDRSHFDRPTSAFNRAVGTAPMVEGLLVGWRSIGCANGPPVFASVHGYSYAQTTWADPSTYQELEVAAQDFVGNRRWEARLERWERELKPERVRECRILAAVDLAAFEDSALVEYIDGCIGCAMRASRIHFEQHALCVLVGELLLSCREWGLTDDEVLPLLEGFSPASVATEAHLRAIADALRAADVRPASLDDIRKASPAAAAALDDYLLEHGYQPIAGFDFDVRTLRELPDIVLASVLVAMEPSPRVGEADPAVVRSKVPEADRSRFDQLLADARSVYGLRDDDVHYSMWARGLVRHALLEAGRRLVDRGRLVAADHVFDVQGLAELRDLLVAGAASPTAGEIHARVEARVEGAKQVPPPTLGDRPAPPPYDDMPPTVRRQTEAMSLYGGLRRSSPSASPLTGIGIGASTYRARAVVAPNADDAFDRIEPGDVLVTVLTTPALNAVLAICGGLVVEAAGTLSHAAVMARELSLPTVIGVTNATRLIPDRAEVEIDPVAGRVTVM